jgi:hypothetical protein
MYAPEHFEQNIGYGTVSTGFFWGDVPGLKSFVLKRRQQVIVQLCEKEWSCALNSINKEGMVAIYPNPSSVSVTLGFDLVEDDAPVSFSILDMAGREVLSQTVILPRGTYSHDVNIEKLAAGIYLLKVSNSCKKFSRKIVIIN